MARVTTVPARAARHCCPSAGTQTQIPVNNFPTFDTVSSIIMMYNFPTWKKKSHLISLRRRPLSTGLTHHDHLIMRNSEAGLARPAYSEKTSWSHSGCAMLMKLTFCQRNILGWGLKRVHREAGLPGLGLLFPLNTSRILDPALILRIQSRGPRWPLCGWRPCQQPSTHEPRGSQPLSQEMCLRP